MYLTLNEEKNSVITKAESYCNDENLQVSLYYDLPDSILETISERSRELPSLYYVSVAMLKSRLENGCFLITRPNKEVVGHIFAHKHNVNNHLVYERASLWVHPDYRNCNLGLLLMSKMTQLYNQEFLISIAQTPKVHYYNELLGMTHITLAEMSKVLVDTLEEIGKLRDELKYKYFVNAYFEKQIRELR